MISYKTIRYLATFAAILALFVVMLGAYTRLTNAGLGCPDWPGCYGHMVLPQEKNALAHAQNLYPDTLIESTKAWTEMAHRYVAGTLAFLIGIIALGVLRLRRRSILIPPTLPLILVLLVVFQAALGMWTVTLKLLPVVVMGHLLGGILIFVSLCCFCMQLSEVKKENLPRWRIWIMLGIIIVFCQIALGGWVSSNYAGIACIGFPTCNGEWFPTLHFSEGFNLFSPIGTNYQGGVLESQERITIQFVHRLGALITATYVLILSILVLLRTKINTLRRVASLAIFFVITQFLLGILNVVYFLPLGVAVAHNGVAALLLATMLIMHQLTLKDKSRVLH